ncbi:MAG: glycosyltransferase [Rhizonema sp. NSF051]|nr:glycosyltransferase [Rhizonema sp. NSF051]
MHILISALHRPAKPTGVCRHAVNLAQCLADTDITQITLVIGSWQQDYFKTSFPLFSKKVKIISVDIKNSSTSRNLWFLFGLPKLAKQLQADLVHLSFPLPFIRTLFHCPVVVTIHDLYAYEYPENFGFPNVIFNQLFFHQCINNSDGLSCVSKCTIESLKKYFAGIEKKKEITVIYNYVDFKNV